jgi:Fur family ferric uptake transcriptional regulator
VNVSVSPVDKFVEYLATQGMRLTTERRIIVEEVFAHHEHFVADELEKRLSQRNDSRRVSRSTVYRMLDLLQKSGLLRKVARTGDKDVYEHDYGYPQHDHLICHECGSLTEFQNDEISRILEEVASGEGFRMDGHRLEVYGLCARCRRPPKRRHRKLDMV